MTRTEHHPRNHPVAPVGVGCPGDGDLGDGAPPLALSAGGGRVPIVVVPPGDEKAWTHPPFGAVIENGVLWPTKTALYAAMAMQS